MYEEKFNEPEIFLNKDFIGVWDNVVMDDFCEHLINVYDNSDFIVGRNYSNVQDTQVDIKAFMPNLSQHIMTAVRLCLNNYLDWYPFLQEWNFHSTVCLLQKTKPTQGYHGFHSETLEKCFSNRTLAWMVYFNDVKEGGETEFLYQRQIIKPKKGRVVIFPGSFTHMHRGNPPYQNKYIATGWLASDVIGKNNIIY